MSKNKLVHLPGLFVLILFSFTSLQSQVGNNTEVLNPNRASEKELLALPHMNSEIADKILEERPFLNMMDLHKLLQASLSEAQLKAFYVACFVPINLNTASEEEMLLVPGVGKRMAHEFEEYRPYIKLAQFRREMGKYVSKEEVARLEQYVFVPINPNTATKEEIMSIPGVGERMHHEFEEYRPFKSIEHFRREIGKYVDEDELNRLLRYIVLE